MEDKNRKETKQKKFGYWNILHKKLMIDTEFNTIRKNAKTVEVIKKIDRIATENLILKTGIKRFNSVYTP